MPAPGSTDTGSARADSASATAATGTPASRSDPVAPLPAARPPAGRDRDADPVAVQPAKPVAPRPVVRPSAVDDTTVGPPCPACGIPNQPGRCFCRRCAAALTSTAAAAPLPWWRTGWPFRRRVRIGGSGNALRRFITLVLIAAVILAAALLYPRERAVYESMRDKLGTPPETGPAAVTANAAVSGHPASAAADGVTNRYWGAPSIGDSITFTFHPPFRLVDLIIHTGESTVPQQFHREARPTALEMVAVDSAGESHRQWLDLDDAPGSQKFVTGISDVVRVTLVIREAAEPPPAATRHIALGEVEFFRRC